jgi:hypothetical protein
LQLRRSIFESTPRMRRRRRAGVVRGPQSVGRSSEDNRRRGGVGEGGGFIQPLFKAKAENEVDAQRGRATQAKETREGK